MQSSTTTCLHFAKEHTGVHVPGATLKGPLINFRHSTFTILHCEPLMARKLLCESVSTTKVTFFVGGRSIRGTWAHLASSLKSTEKYWLQSPYHSHVRIETYIKHKADLMLLSDVAL